MQSSSNLRGLILNSRAQRSQALLAAADQRILVLDGATGTAFQAQDLGPADFGGAELEGCNENLVFTRPDIVRGVHEMYLEAGCDIVETNTFGGTPIVLGEYGLQAKTYELNKRACEIAREACAKYTTPERPRFVAGSIGPTTKAISVTGGITFEELIENFYQQMLGLFDGGADYFLIETAQDSRNIKAALIAADKVFAEKGERLPVAVSGTIETMGTMLAGQTVEALVAAVEHYDLFYIGLNCATGPEFMTDHIRSLAALAPFRVACVPNAGLPDDEGCYLETPEMMTNVLKHFITEGWINFVGGCCGTRKDHIHSFSDLVQGKKPRTIPATKRSMLSGIDYLEVTDDLRPVIVGERTNVIGSKKFKELITAEKYEEASEIARLQVKAGAQIIDICLANPDRNEYQDMERFLEYVIKKVKVPIMIDSTDEKVIERSLTFLQGKAIINSINLEDGEERFEHVVPLAKRFGAALVVGTIDEDPEEGMAVTRERKLEIAVRSFDLLTKKYGIKAEDIYFDPLVFPCATGDEKYVGSALETIEGLRLIKQRLPQCKTALGISNVSFGLPAAGREVLNAVFLYHCVQAGLDLAIVNSEKLERYGSLPQDEIELAENLLFNRKTEQAPDPVAAFAARFREKKVRAKADKASIPLEKRLASYIVEGTKEGLIEDLEEARKINKPLDIINGPLMAGMDEVGRLFNDNKLIVAEVLQSAEVMKAAVAHLEPFMDKADVSTRGKIVLATVKGDVHDIGKNLVDIILSNNGFRVINLGIKIPPEQLIAAVREHKPDMVGLSGLLVKSAQQMVTTAEDMTRAGVQVPILVGGAALSRSFTERKILAAYSGAVLYAQDAMNGLDLANKVMNPEQMAILNQQLEVIRKERAAAAQTESEKPTLSTADLQKRSDSVSILKDIPQPPDFKRHIDRQTPIEQIWKYINPLMLYTRHLGIKARSAKLFENLPKDVAAARQLKEEDPRALEIWEQVEEVKAQYRATNILKPAGVYRYFKAASEGNRILLFEENSTKPITHFDFNRQSKGERLCLADYLRPIGGELDNMAMFVTTVGQGLREEAARLKESGQFLKSHILQALAIESAEAFAELMHAHLRTSWGFPDAPSMSMIDRFQAKYRGKRYSFGYPACPNLEDQTQLFEVLNPAEIGVQLTEGFMMDPEASVSAIAFHHPEAKYFGV